MSLLKDKLATLAEDIHMLQAIETVFNEAIDKEKPVINANHTNEIIGEMYRSYTVAQIILNNVLRDIKSYKEQKSNPKPTNKGK